MRYDEFRRRGYDIGSTVVEGSCKHVVGKRLKQSGMIWSRPGSSSTLALRISWLNREWDPRPRCYSDHSYSASIAFVD